MQAFQKRAEKEADDYNLLALLVVYSVNYVGFVTWISSALPCVCSRTRD